MKDLRNWKGTSDEKQRSFPPCKGPKKEILVVSAALLLLILLIVLIFRAGTHGFSAPAQPGLSALSSSAAGAGNSPSSIPQTASSFSSSASSAASTTSTSSTAPVSIHRTGNAAVRPRTTASPPKTTSARTTASRTTRPPITAEAESAVSREVRAKYADRIAKKEAAHESAQANYTRQLEEIALERYDRERRVNETYANNGLFGSDAHQAALESARVYRQADYERIQAEKKAEQQEYEEWSEQIEQTIRQEIAAILSKEYAVP